MPRGPLCCFWVLALTAGVPPMARAQVLYPPPPASYRVELRYDISRDDRPLRIRQYRELAEDLKAAGFSETASPDNQDADLNPEADRLRGTIDPKNLAKLLAVRNVGNVVVAPADLAPPAEPDAVTLVAIHLRDLRLPDRQRPLYNQAHERLRAMGYRDGFAYDTRGDTLLRGTLPAGQLPNLLRDLRNLPDGWLFAFDEPAGRPEPIRSVPPVRWAEVFAGSAPARLPAAPLPEIAIAGPARAKISPELLRAAARAPGLLRINVEAEGRVDPSRFRRTLAAISPDATLLSARANLATVQLPANALEPLASVPEVKQLLLSPGFVLADGPVAAPPKEPKLPAEPKASRAPSFKVHPVSLVAPRTIGAVTGVDALHAAGRRGRYVRAALVASDFAGYEQFVGKGLGSKTRLLDLTRELSPEAKPLPPGPNAIGAGTEAALAFSLAAPEAELTLVRVAPDGESQLVQLVGALRDGLYASEALESQRIFAGQLLIDRTIELNRANALLAAALEDFDDSDEAVQRRDAARARVADVRRRITEATNSQIALGELLVEAQQLKGVDLLVNTLTWDSGVAADGLGELARAIDEQLRDPETTGIRRLGRPQVKTPLWLQSAGDSRGRTWSGPFLDADGDRVMEFGVASPLGNEFAALGSDGGGDKPDLTLKAGTRLKASIQWREPHEPTVPEDEYLQPVSRLQLQLVRQIDPDAKTLPSDELDLTAASGLKFTRLATSANYGVYEGSFEVTVPADGRYLLRVAADMGPGSLPRSRPTVPGGTPRVELSPKIVLDSSGPGRVVFAQVHGPVGGVGSPGDARRAVTVGVLHPSGAPDPRSAVGAGPGLKLATKPDFLIQDEVVVGARTLRGSAAATGYAGGLAASLIGAGASTANFRSSLRLEPGSALIVPEAWRRR